MTPGTPQPADPTAKRSSPAPTADATLTVPHAELLCERCGYRIAEVPSDANCPECGTPVASSSPALRTGSPWQCARADRINFSWEKTGVAILRDAEALFGLIRVGPTDARRARRLILIHAIICALLSASVVPTAAYLIRGATISDGDLIKVYIVPRTAGDEIVAGITAAIWITLTFFGILGMSYIETLGVRFFGGRRSWRITPNVAWAVIGHASYGWLIGTILWIPLLIIYLKAGGHEWAFGLLDGFDKSQGLPFMSSYGYARAIPPAALALLGILCFESLVYLGIRRCRFANW